MLMAAWQCGSGGVAGACLLQGPPSSSHACWRAARALSCILCVSHLAVPTSGHCSHRQGCNSCMDAAYTACMSHAACTLVVRSTGRTHSKLARPRLIGIAPRILHGTHLRQDSSRQRLRTPSGSPRDAQLEPRGSAVRAEPGYTCPTRTPMPFDVHAHSAARGSSAGVAPVRVCCGAA